jgi:hypothetical protein
MGNKNAPWPGLIMVPSINDFKKRVQDKIAFAIGGPTKTQAKKLYPFI